MPKVEFGTIEGFRGPSRWPWLLIVIAVIGVAVWRYRTHRPTPEIQAAPKSDRAAVVEKTRAPAPTNVARRAATPAPAAPGGPVSLSHAREMESRGDLLKAREIYLRLLEKTSDGAERAEAERRVGGVNVRLAMSPQDGLEKAEYVVKKGDSVDRIAKQFGTTVELLKAGNDIKNVSVIKAGDRLRVIRGKFRVEVSKQRNELVLYLNDRFFKRYRVGTGKHGKTPTGTFRISERIRDPVWWRPDGREIPYGNPENILGTRWMTLRATGGTPDAHGYGIHGTWEPESIGKTESAGCIRMLNGDVEELFVLVPVGTSVSIAQ